MLTNSYQPKLKLVNIEEYSNLNETTQELIELLEIILPKFLSFVERGQEGGVVLQPITKEKLASLLPLEFQLKGIQEPEFSSLVQTILDYSVNQWSNKFNDKLYGSSNPIGVISDFILAILNCNSHVYHVSPVMSLIELATSKALANLFGLKERWSGGITLPGGAASNHTAMVTARNIKFPQIKELGYQSNLKLSVFTSKSSHYSIEKAAIAMGLGLKSVYKVRCNIEGRMDVFNLEELIEESLSKGETPYFLNATSGTTVQGAFDELDKLAIISKKYNLWLHLDGSWGGSLIFSSNANNLLKGSELVNSITINPHKLLGVPLQCSFLLLNDRRLLNLANSLKADYLFHEQQIEDSSNELEWLLNYNDLGDGTLGCGRRPDAFKFYLAWQYYGQLGLTERVDKALNNANYLKSKILDHPKFQLVFNPTSINVCFWFVPNNLRKNFEYDYLTEEFINSQSNNNLVFNEIGEITKKIHQQLHIKGRFMIDFSPLNYQLSNGEKILIPPFFRMVFNAPNMNYNTIDQLLLMIEEEASLLGY